MIQELAEPVQAAPTYPIRSCDRISSQIPQIRDETMQPPRLRDGSYRDRGHTARRLLCRTFDNVFYLLQGQENNNDASVTAGNKLKVNKTWKTWEKLQIFSKTARQVYKQT